MNRALANFIMRGRAQAILIAVLIIPLIPQAALALVTLRRGALEGLMLLPWAILPTLVMLWGDEGIVALAVPSVVTLVGVFAGAMLLRLQAGWALAAVSLAGICLLSGGLYQLLFDSTVTQLLDQWIELQKQALDARGMDYDESQLNLPPNRDFIGLGALGMGINMVLALVLGRWWQALLYNPGGFRQEFSQLRLTPLQALLCTAATALCLVNQNYRLWALIPALPLVLVSVAVAHQFAAVQRMGRTWLVIFYIALANMPFYLAIALLGLLDTWMDMRGRLIGRRHKKEQDKD